MKRTVLLIETACRWEWPKTYHWWNICNTFLMKCDTKLFTYTAAVCNKVKLCRLTFCVQFTVMAFLTYWINRHIWYSGRYAKGCNTFGSLATTYLKCFECWHLTTLLSFEMKQRIVPFWEPLINGILLGTKMFRVLQHIGHLPGHANKWWFTYVINQFIGM